MTSEQIAAISEMIISKYAETGSIRTAYDSVMGEGAYDKLAGQIYDLLNHATQ